MLNNTENNYICNPTQFNSTDSKSSFRNNFHAILSAQRSCFVATWPLWRDRYHRSFGRARKDLYTEKWAMWLLLCGIALRSLLRHRRQTTKHDDDAMDCMTNHGQTSTTGPELPPRVNGILSSNMKTFGKRLSTRSREWMHWNYWEGMIYYQQTWVMIIRNRLTGTNCSCSGFKVQFYSWAFWIV